MESKRWYFDKIGFYKIDKFRHLIKTDPAHVFKKRDSYMTLCFFTTSWFQDQGFKTYLYNWRVRSTTAPQCCVPMAVEAQCWPILPWLTTERVNWFRSTTLFRENLSDPIHMGSIYPSCRMWVSLQWRHNGRDGVSDHQPHDCLLRRLFRRRSKKTLKLRVTDLCAGNSPVTGEFPAHMASNAENVFIWWRHHICVIFVSSNAKIICTGNRS